MCEPQQEPRPFWALKLLASMRVAMGLVGAIVVACIIATLLPQGPEVAEQIQRNPEAGRWLKRLAAAGLTNIFASWWFLGLLTALGASLAVCVARRLKVLLAMGVGVAGKALTWGTLLVHLGMLLTLGGGVIKLFWSERGTVALREGEQASAFVADDQRRVPLPYTLQLVKFEIEQYETLAVQWLETKRSEEFPVAVGVERLVTPKVAAGGRTRSLRVTVLRRIPDFTLDPVTRVVQSRSDKMLNPALLVRVVGNGPAVDRWLFARYPDFDKGAMSRHASPTKALPFELEYKVAGIKSFKSSLRILKDAKVVREQTIEVNAPLSHGGYSFFQSGYNEDDLTWTALLVVRDPSVPIVYLGFALLSIGAFLTACWRAEKIKEESQC